jgi:hypothetical protein
VKFPGPVLGLISTLTLVSKIKIVRREFSLEGKVTRERRIQTLERERAYDQSTHRERLSSAFDLAIDRY